MSAIDNEYFIRKAMNLDAETFGTLMDTACYAVATAHTVDNYNDEVNYRPAAQQ